jgi:hypothetical protein
MRLKLRDAGVMFKRGPKQLDGLFVNLLPFAPDDLICRQVGLQSSHSTKSPRGN